jgi:aspartyl-tRNA synthetase
MEMAFIEGEEDVMSLVEGVVAHSIARVGESCAPVLEELGVRLAVPATPFPRVTYTEAVDLVSDAAPVEWGEDLSTEAEKALGAVMAERGHELYFITGYPSRIKPFYIMERADDPRVCRAFDLEVRGLEIASGGQREHRPDVLVARMKGMGLDPAEFTFYLDAFRYGMPPHGGLGLGIERLVQTLLDARNVREAVLFPRDRGRLVP